MRDDDRYRYPANRLTKLEGGVTTSYSYDEASQLSVEWTPSARTTYSYDANGNTQVINAAGSLTTHTWDLEDRMTKVEVAGGAVNTMSYDGDGKRRRTEDSDGLRNVIWDQENIALETDSGNNTVAAYTHAPEGYGELISQRRSGSTSFHHFDALGSTRVLTNSAQTATDTRDYKAFGLTNASSGSSANRFWWVGHWGYYVQPDSSDYWVRARVEEPTSGRWRSRDPLGTAASGYRATNVYAYAANTPTLRVDPSGLHVQPPGATWVEESCGVVRIIGLLRNLPGFRWNLLDKARCMMRTLAPTLPSLPLDTSVYVVNPMQYCGAFTKPCGGWWRSHFHTYLSDDLFTHQPPDFHAWVVNLGTTDLHEQYHRDHWLNDERQREGEARAHVDLYIRRRWRELLGTPVEPYTCSRNQKKVTNAYFDLVCVCGGTW